MFVPWDPPQPRLHRLLIAGTALLLSSCSGGENRRILKPTIKTSLAQTPPPQADGVVFFDNVVVTGDSISLDVVVRDSTDLLDLDDVDLVLRYDASFIQVLSVAGQNTLFGTCNTVNPACGVNSPICTHNRATANGGGESFCRSNGSTTCTADADCTTPSDKCGSFGRLLASLIVLTGPRTCSNDPNRACAMDADCHLCASNTNQACATDADCSGTCDASQFCTNLPTRSCVSNADCADACTLGTCRGCPSVVVSGTQTIASLALRVIAEGTSEFRFVVSADPQATASFARKDLVEQNVLFFPNVDAADPSVKTGAIVITGILD